MKGIREIKGRIKAVKNTAQITKAMQLVAASKMKRAQDIAKQGRPYSLLLADIMTSLLELDADFAHPLFEEREVKRRGVIVIGTDKGLCGSLNSNLFKMIMRDFDSSKTSFVTVGRKAKQFVARTQRDLIADFSVSDKCGFTEVRPIIEYMLKAYYDGSIDTIELVYTNFVNTLVQEPVRESLLPLNDLKAELKEWKKRADWLEDTAQPKDTRELQTEPDPETLLQELPELFVKQEVFQRILEAKASEHSARMVAMKNATENAKNLVDDLTLEYNKARQAAITQEILEIAASAAA